MFRHTTAVHLVEAGVEINVIRGWLGHVSLDTTNRYAEITTRAKEAALRVCEAPPAPSAALPAQPVWRTDESLLAWTSLQQRLFKTGGRLIRHARYFILQLAESHWQRAT